MFTGIIETMGEVASATKVGGDVRIVVSAPAFADKQIAIGDSIACNGVCLTVIEQKAGRFSFDVSVESISHSLIGEWQSGAKVNLELAMQPQGRLGGHLVSGHVDGLAELVELKEDARSWRLTFRAPEDLKKYIAQKGSITINGVSLTVNSVLGRDFEVNIIPHTFDVTTLGDLLVGSKVHIEVDLIARYLERLLTGDTDASSSLSYSFLADHGFA